MGNRLEVAAPGPGSRSKARHPGGGPRCLACCGADTWAGGPKEVSGSCWADLRGGWISALHQGSRHQRRNTSADLRVRLPVRDQRPGGRNPDDASQVSVSNRTSHSTPPRTAGRECASSSVCRATGSTPAPAWSRDRPPGAGAVRFGSPTGRVLRRSTHEGCQAVRSPRPLSPMARHGAGLKAQHEKLTQQVEKQPPSSATSTPRPVPPWASWRAAEKGDGLLSVADGSTKPVPEPTDSHRTIWGTTSTKPSATAPPPPPSDWSGAQSRSAASASAPSALAGP